MASYGYPPRNRYSFLGSPLPVTNPGIDSGGRMDLADSYFPQATNPGIDSNGGTGQMSSYFRGGNGESYVMTVETIVQRVPPAPVPAGSYEVARDRPTFMDEFLKKIQTEVNQPTSMSVSPFGVPRTAPIVQFGPATQVDFREFTNGTPRPTTGSGFIEQGRGTTLPVSMTPTPPRFNTRISPVINDISEATEFLKEQSRPMRRYKADTVTTPQNPELWKGAANKGSAQETIDSQEARRRYKDAIVSMEPYGKESSTPMMDSKTAKEKYGGMFV